MNAELKNLVECVLIKVDVGKERYREIDEHMSRQMRDSDYLGLMSDGKMYLLLTNTTKENADVVQERFEKLGYQTENVEKMAVCRKE